MWLVSAPGPPDLLDLNEKAMGGRSKSSARRVKCSTRCSAGSSAVMQSSGKVLQAKKICFHKKDDSRNKRAVPAPCSGKTSARNTRTSSRPTVEG